MSGTLHVFDFSDSRQLVGAETRATGLTRNTSRCRSLSTSLRTHTEAETNLSCQKIDFIRKKIPHFVESIDETALAAMMVHHNGYAPRCSHFTHLHENGALTRDSLNAAIASVVACVTAFREMPEGGSIFLDLYCDLDLSLGTFLPSWKRSGSKSRQSNGTSCICRHNRQTTFRGNCSQETCDHGVQHRALERKRPPSQALCTHQGYGQSDETSVHAPQSASGRRTRRA